MVPRPSWTEPSQSAFAVRAAMLFLPDRLRLPKTAAQQRRRAPLPSDPGPRGSCSPHRLLLIRSRGLSQSCYKVSINAILAASPQPRELPAPAASPTWERAVWWRAPPCPSSDTPVTNTPSPTPLTAPAPMADPLLVVRWADVVVVVLA